MKKRNKKIKLLTSNWICAVLLMQILISAAKAEITTEPLDPVDLLATISDSSAEIENIEIKEAQIKTDNLLPQENYFTAINYIENHNEKLLQSKSVFAGEIETGPSRQLWRARISISKDETQNESKKKLKQAIKELNNITLQMPKANESAKSAEPAEQTVVAEANEMKPQIKNGKKPLTIVKPEKIEIAIIKEPLDYEPISVQTLQAIEDLSQKPQLAKKPFELAEVLFHCGHFEQAAIFYQQALDNKASETDDKSYSAKDKAWILFQTGNCLKKSDPEKALKMYRELITEFPDSPWTDAAKVQDKVINLYQKENPVELIEKCKP